jgi:hypothetical protein
VRHAAALEISLISFELSMHKLESELQAENSPHWSQMRSTAPMTLGSSLIRFALPAMGRGRDGFRLTGELAKPNAALLPRILN